MAELSSLLSFMQEGDRKTALSMYSKMFDDAPSEQELISYLVSPTRQAVKLARVYDSSSEGSSAEFIDEINAVQPAPADGEAGYAPLEDQAALFTAQTASAQTVPPSRRRQAWKDEPYQNSTSTDVDTFISDFRINDEISAAKESGLETAAGAEPAGDNNAVPLTDVSLKKGTVTKVSIPLLILYTIFAIPVTSFIIVLIILLALSFLGLASVSGYIGFLLISSAFGGFAVFADIMVVLGVALVIVALAILFMWIFIWLLGGLIVSAVKGAINLGNKLCVREVEA